MTDSALLPARLDTIDAPMLTPLVRQATQRPDLVITDWALEPLFGIGGGMMGTSIHRVTGRGQDQHGDCDWSLILKILHTQENQAPHSSHYWKREFEAYRSGWLNALPGGLTAPRCYDSAEYPEGCWLWLENIPDQNPGPWTLERYGLAAYHLGQFNGTYLNGDRLDWPWLSRDWVRQDTANAAAFYAEHLAVCLHDPYVQNMLPGTLPDQIQQFWPERASLFAALDQLPKTICHLDAFRRNLFTCAQPDGCTDSVAIDWAFVGYEAIGADLVSLVLVSIAHREWDIAQAHTLDQTAFARYIEGLRDAGWTGDPRRVRLGYTAALVLRFLAMTSYAVPPMTTDEGRAFIAALLNAPVEVGMSRYAEVSRFALEIGTEARSLRDQLA